MGSSREGHYPCSWHCTALDGPNNVSLRENLLYAGGGHTGLAWSLPLPWSALCRKWRYYAVEPQVEAAANEVREVSWQGVEEQMIDPGFKQEAGGTAAPIQRILATRLGWATDHLNRGVRYRVETPASRVNSELLPVQRLGNDDRRIARDLLAVCLRRHAGGVVGPNNV
jgi:hypothetical protein